MCNSAQDLAITSCHSLAGPAPSHSDARYCTQTRDVFTL